MKGVYNTIYEHLYKQWRQEIRRIFLSFIQAQ